MINKIWRFIMAALPAAALLVVGTTGAAASEAAGTRANVPFAFDVNGEHFEAGHYAFEQRPGTWLVILRLEEGKASAFMGTPIGNPNGKPNPKLVFYQVDGKYYLAEVWLAGSGMGKKAPVKKAIEFTAKQRTVTRIEVALNR